MGEWPFYKEAKESMLPPSRCPRPERTYLQGWAFLQGAWGLKTDFSFLSRLHAGRGAQLGA